MRAPFWILVAVLVIAGCEGRPASLDGGRSADAGLDASSSADAGGPRDAGASLDAGDASIPRDAGGSDGGSGADAATGSDAGTDAGTTVDAGTDAGAIVDAGTDAGTPARSDHHIHIDVDNVCDMTVTPTEITVPADQTAYFDWHNHSADYPVDVWMSYGGGYTDLATGDTWDEPIGHCATPSVHDEYADISTACSSFRFLIHCN